MTKRFWLSFVDRDKPEGERSLGACIVEVDEDDAADARAIIDAKFPKHAEGAEWIAAATRMAHLMACNPGGEVGVKELPDTKKVRAAPLHRLLSKAEWERLGVA